MPEQSVFEEIMLHHPPPLRIEHTLAKVDLIDFDLDNPRLRYLRSLNPGKSDSDLLFDDNDTKWLKGDIKEKGLLDAPYVKRIAGGRHICVEGNRRLACMKSLTAEFPDDAKFKCIQVRVLPETTTEAQAALLMASFHVAGKLQWDAHEKAGHIYHMTHVLKIPEEELKNTLHMGAPAIKRTAESYRILREVFCTIDQGAYAKDADGKWSFFSEMVKDKQLRSRYHEKDPRWCETFSRWVGEGRIPNAADVRALPEILAQSNARRIFETSPAEEAFRLSRMETDRSNPANMSTFYKQLQKLLDTLMAAEFRDIELAGNNEAAKLLLQDTYAKIGEFMERAGVRVMPSSTRRVA
jgi:hypothetical protein